MTKDRTLLGLSKYSLLSSKLACPSRNSLGTTGFDLTVVACVWRRLLMENLKERELFLDNVNFKAIQEMVLVGTRTLLSLIDPFVPILKIFLQEMTLCF